MKTNQEIIREWVEKEIKEELYNIRILSIPIWNIVRFRVRTTHLYKINGFKSSTKKTGVNCFSVIKKYFISFFRFINLILKRDIKAKYLFYAFPRLQNVGNNNYIDKFTDPVISSGGILKESIIIQRSLFGNHFPNRIHKEKLIENDFIDYTSILLGVLLFPFFFVFCFHGFFSLYKGISKVHGLTKSNYITIPIEITTFFIRTWFTEMILTKINPQSVFVVNRSTFSYVISACKRKKIPVYEFQHGVTPAESILYSGPYSPEIDPDLFLVFSKLWVGPQFGMPIDKIYNIGWAYGEYIKEKVDLQIHDENNILAISEPSITDLMVQFLCELAIKYPLYVFHLRHHPQESFTKKHIDKIDKIPNIVIADAKLESTIALQSFSHVLGVNSSVLYEALQYKKKVGRISFFGFNCISTNQEDSAGFFYLKNFEDFALFLKSELSLNEKTFQTGYNPFDLNKFNKIIMNKI